MRRTQRDCFVHGTWLNIRTQLRAYFLFCTFFGITPVPASLETVLLYTQFLSRSFKAPQSIKNYLNGVKFLHILLGFEYAFTGNYMIALLFRGIERNANHVPQRAAPMTPDVLQVFARITDFSDSRDLVTLAASFLLFFLMARAGNVFARHSDPHIGLRRKDIRFSGNMMYVTFKRTKTIQFGEATTYDTCRCQPYIYLPSFFMSSHDIFYSWPTFRSPVFVPSSRHIVPFIRVHFYLM